jgi:hypothetical protein
MYWIGYLLARLAAIAVGWLVPLVVVALVLPLLQIVYIWKPIVAVVVMLIMGGLLVYYSIQRQTYWQAIVWAALWGLGVLTSFMGWLHWYVLLVEGILVVVLTLPGLVVTPWANFFRWFAAFEIGLTLLLFLGQGSGMSGSVMIISLLLIVLAALIGAGSFRPFETRRLRRNLARLAMLVPVLLVLWHPVIQPAIRWVGNAAVSVGQAVSSSPVVRWYRVWSLQTERREIGEFSKTEALRQLQTTLIEAHKARWEQGISQISSLPLSTDEWGDIGIPPEADP